MNKLRVWVGYVTSCYSPTNAMDGRITFIFDDLVMRGRCLGRISSFKSGNLLFHSLYPLSIPYVYVLTHHFPSFPGKILSNQDVFFVISLHSGQ